MKHSSFLPWDMPAELFAAPHVFKPGVTVNNYFPYSRQHAPSSHLFSTVDDMNRFALAQLNRGELDGLAIVVMVNREYPLEDFSYRIIGWLLAPTPAQGNPGSPARLQTHS